MDETEIPKKLQNEDEETISLISSLPLDVDFDGTKLFKYQGYWYNDKTLQGVLHFQRGFEPKDMDIIIASFPKSGTTWLKALTVDLLERSKQKHSSDDHPLLLDNPHGLVPFLELRLFTETSKPDLTTISSSLRLFSTHMGFQTLREALKNSPCKIVYVGRNMKDRSYQLRIIMGTCLELLESKLGRLQVEEEESGSVEEILDLCSLGNLKNLEINKTGKTLKGPEHKNFFREGEVGDSKNYLTPEMEKIIDMIIEEKFRGSDLKF
ncbi:unnamed protein product [Arabidopsis lyrata]|nr:unnamed protein product [Arabidopsis lyrata]